MIPEDDSIWAIALKSLPIQSLHGVLSLILWVILLRYLDWSVKVKHSAHLPIIASMPLALALYKGLRLVAVAIIVGESTR